MKKIIAVLCVLLMTVSTSLAENSRKALEMIRPATYYDYNSGEALFIMPEGFIENFYDVCIEENKDIDYTLHDFKMNKGDYAIKKLVFKDGYTEHVSEKYARIIKDTKIYLHPDEKYLSDEGYICKVGMSYPILAISDEWTQLRIYSSAYIRYIKTSDIEIINRDDLLPKGELNGSAVEYDGLYVCENNSDSHGFIRQGDNEHIIKPKARYTLYLHKGDVEYSSNMSVYACTDKPQDKLPSGSRIFAGIESNNSDEKYSIAVSLLDKAFIRIYSLDETLIEEIEMEPHSVVELRHYEGNLIEFVDCGLSFEKGNG